MTNLIRCSLEPEQLLKGIFYKMHKKFSKYNYMGINAGGLLKSVFILYMLEPKPLSLISYYYDMQDDCRSIFLV